MDLFNVYLSLKIFIITTYNFADSRSSLGDQENGECCGLYLIKDKLQNALFQHVRERCDHSLNRTSSRKLLSHLNIVQQMNKKRKQKKEGNYGER
jgi:hypothetical protein